MSEARKASIERKTHETDIALELGVNGSGKAELTTGVPFLGHMLDLFAKHGQFDLRIQANGDTDVDDHHTTEDIALCLGQAVRQALGDKAGIKRYGHAFVPMDEALAQVVIDLSNRPYFVFHGTLPGQKVGTFDTELVDEFLSKFVTEARMNMHIVLHYGSNTHHMIEAIFKAVGRALDVATQIDPRVSGVPSTKGML